MEKSTVAIVGASGRMGSLVLELIDRHYADRLEIAALLGSADQPEKIAHADIIIDFSLPPGTARLIDWLASNSAGPQTFVSGTTGLDATLLERLRKLADSRRIMHAANFSAGIAALAAILEQAAPMLARLAFTPVLTEVHHCHKKDAPSGTAITLEESALPFTNIQTHSIRAGEVVGNHELAFYGDHERISIGHEALDRGVFARGAIEAAIWLDEQDQTSGLFTMQSYFRERFLSD